MSDYQTAYTQATGRPAPVSAPQLDTLFAKIAAGEPLPPRGQQAVDAGLTAHSLLDPREAPASYAYYQWVVTHLFQPGEINELTARLIGMAFTSANIFVTDLPQPLTLNPWQVTRLADLRVRATQAVVIENNGVFALLHQLHPTWPMVVQGGNDFQPAYVRVMQHLVAGGLRVTYLGDLDSEGIRIADTLLGHLPVTAQADFLALQTPARVSAWVTNYGRSDAGRTGSREIHDATLQTELDTIRYQHRFVEQEQLIGDYEALIAAWLG